MLSKRELVAGLAACSVIAPAPAHAAFKGRLVVTFDADGRTVTLLQPYAFVDPGRLEWSVPVGAKVDGASIPRLFWPLIGGPFEGKYRNASVIHDWYCDRRTRPWRQVHRAFYDAMLESGVDTGMARVMYAAVTQFGPKWSQVAVSNNNLQVAWSSLPSGNAAQTELRKLIIDAAIMNAARRSTGSVPDLATVFKIDPAAIGFLKFENGRLSTTARVAAVGDTDTASVSLTERVAPTPADVARLKRDAPRMSAAQIEALAAPSVRDLSVPGLRDVLALPVDPLATSIAATPGG